MTRSGALILSTVFFGIYSNPVINGQILASLQQAPVTPPGGASAAPLSLTLQEAIARGLRENVDARVHEADVTAARGFRSGKPSLFHPVRCSSSTEASTIRSTST